MRRPKSVSTTSRCLSFEGGAFDEIEVDRNGKYFLDLPLRHDYVIVFSAEGLVAKRVAINSASTPEGELPDGFMFDLDMSLFDMIEGFDEGIMETPIGIARLTSAVAGFNSIWTTPTTCVVASTTSWTAGRFGR